MSRDLTERLEHADKVTQRLAVKVAKLEFENTTLEVDLETALGRLEQANQLLAQQARRIDILEEEAALARAAAEQEPTTEETQD